jgi:TRAP-type C4-dicarboxylate transport system substrate-binding protein
MQWSGATSFGFHNVTKYRTQVDIYTGSFPVIMNLQTWNSLPADMQKVFADNSDAAHAQVYDEAFAKGNEAMRQVIADAAKKAGKPDIFVPSPEERARIIATVMPVWDKWVADAQAKGLPSKAMLDDAIALVKKYSQAK